MNRTEIEKTLATLTERIKAAEVEREMYANMLASAVCQLEPGDVIDHIQGKMFCARILSISGCVRYDRPHVALNVVCLNKSMEPSAVTKWLYVEINDIPNPRNRVIGAGPLG